MIATCYEMVPKLRSAVLAGSPPNSINWCTCDPEGYIRSRLTLEDRLVSQT